MDELLIWIKKLELCNKYIESKEVEKSLNPKLYSEVNRFIQDAFLQDFNLIVEEFEMYQRLTPKMQNSIMEELDTFKMFRSKFDKFFDSCEKGFRNEFIIQMYTREFPAGSEIITVGKKFREIFFITMGGVNLFTKQDVIFMNLTEGTVFGDY